MCWGKEVGADGFGACVGGEAAGDAGSGVLMCIRQPAFNKTPRTSLRFSGPHRTRWCPSSYRSALQRPFSAAARRKFGWILMRSTTSPWPTLVRCLLFLLFFSAAQASNCIRESERISYTFPFAGQGIRKLIKTNFVLRKPPTVHSRSRVRRRDLAKRKVLPPTLTTTPILSTTCIHQRLPACSPLTVAAGSSLRPRKASWYQRSAYAHQGDTPLTASRSPPCSCG